MAPGQAISLYRGRVFHARLRPLSHRFSYRVFSILIDLDRLDDADRTCGLFSVNRANLFSFHEQDHGACNGSSVRKHVDSLLRSLGVNGDGVRVLLLCYPRVLGFAFNPIAVYYAFGPEDEPIAILYEVRNTFGESHTYATRIGSDMLSPSGLRHSLDKAFHVSPFMDMRQRYRFRLSRPEDAIRIRILQSDGEGPVFSAGFAASRQDLTVRTVLAAFCAMPLMTAKVVAGIHWEALRLWLKGLRVHSRPPVGERPTAPMAQNNLVP